MNKKGTMTTTEQIKELESLAIGSLQNGDHGLSEFYFRLSETITSLTKERDELAVLKAKQSVANSDVLTLAELRIQRLRTRLEASEKERITLQNDYESLSDYFNNLSARFPTMAQIMVYKTLQDKYEASEAKGAQMRMVLEGIPALYEYLVDGLRFLPHEKGCPCWSCNAAKDIRRDIERVKSALSLTCGNFVLEELKELRKLLAVAKCPNCDGSGAKPVPGSHGECLAEQCQWCFERTALDAAKEGV